MTDLNYRFHDYLFPKPPFNFDGTVYVPHHFRTLDFEWREGVCWQTMNLAEMPLGIKMENKGTLARPKIKLSMFSSRKLTDQEKRNAIEEINWRYGLQEDISKFCLIFRADRFLKLPLRRLCGMRVNCANNLYELLIISIALQNATVGRSIQMIENLMNGYGSRLRFDGKGLFAYWSPKAIEKSTEKELRLLKVGYRAKMIKKISDNFEDGVVDEYELRNMPTEDAKEKLMGLYGVGPATAQIIIGEYLRRYETLDLQGKFWEQKILSRVLFNKKLVPMSKILSLFRSRYGKWQGLAFHYIFTDLFWRHKEKRINWLEKEIRM